MIKKVITRAILVSLMVSFVGSQSTWAQTSPPEQQAQSVSQAQPTIEFVRPHQSETVADYPLHIQVKVSNFELLPPVQYWKRVVDPEDAAKGHIHFTLDDSPIYATDKTVIMLGKNGGRSLPLGKHILRAELRNVNHRGLKSPVVAEIAIVCKRADQGDQKSSSSISSTTGTTTAAGQPPTQRMQQIQQLRRQINEVQQEVLQLQSERQKGQNQPDQP